jgi:hypothetical protein
MLQAACMPSIARGPFSPRVHAVANHICRQLWAAACERGDDKPPTDLGPDELLTMLTPLAEVRQALYLCVSSRR